jgi:hypothetical protein
LNTEVNFGNNLYKNITICYIYNNMITVSKHVEIIVKDSPFLEEGLALGVINLTALARKLKPKIESKSLKRTSTGAIVMALQRLGIKLKHKNQRHKILMPQDITVKSGLLELTYLNSPGLRQKYQYVLKLAEHSQDMFFNVLQGVFETSIIASRQIIEETRKILKGEKLLSSLKDLASLTLRFAEEAIYTPGAYYSILKHLAWEGINVVEVISIHNELSIVVEQKKVDKAFSIVNALIQK